MSGTFRALVVLLLTAQLAKASGLAVFNSPFLYDWGLYGVFPRSFYKSFKGNAPLLNFRQWDERCDDGGYYLLSPRGSMVSKPGPVIFDPRGNLVWTDDSFGVVTDFKVQSYKGKDYLTFWSGTDGVKYRYGRGTYYMLDQSYAVFRTIHAVGEGLMGDLHDFKITDEETALMTVYLNTPADLSPIGGPTAGWILDSVIQEVDIETGALLFEWRASKHVDIRDSMLNFALESKSAGRDPQTSFDFFHINSVDKDENGNYVVSARHMHSIMCISAADPSKTLWVLGGTKNEFTDISDGHATDFMWQHHARMHANNTITIFDNARSESIEYVGEYSRGLLLQIDTTAWTVELLREYADPKHRYRAQSQGSAQLFDDGKILLGYGFLPNLVEFAPDGRVLCDVRLAPLVVSSFGMVTSYRAFKSKRWVGKPKTSPSVFFKPSEGRLFVSWLGATEVHRWVLQGADWEGVQQDRYVDLLEKVKDEFEVPLLIHDGMPDYVRVAGLDADGNVLKHSEVISRKVGNAPATWYGSSAFTLWVCLAIAFALVGLNRRKIFHMIERIRRSGIPQAKFWVGRKDVPAAHEVQRLYQD